MTKRVSHHDRPSPVYVYKKTMRHCTMITNVPRRPQSGYKCNLPFAETADIMTPAKDRPFTVPSQLLTQFMGVHWNVYGNVDTIWRYNCKLDREEDGWREIESEIQKQVTTGLNLFNRNEMYLLH